MIRTTLQRLTERLPRALQNRYSLPAGAFWVDMYNDLLGELERMACGPNGIISVPIPWEMCQNEVVLPQQLVDVTAAYRSTTGPENGKLSIAPSEGGFFIVDEVPAASTMVGHDSLSLQQFRGRDWVASDAIDLALAGDAIITHSGPPGNDSYFMSSFPTAAWIATTVTADSTGRNVAAIPYEQGEQDWAPVGSQHSFVFRDFLVAIGHRKYKRAASLASQSSIAPEWDELVATWLRFKGETQTDAESEQAALWARAWVAQSERWKAFHTRAPINLRPKGLRLPLVMNGAR